MINQKKKIIRCLDALNQLQIVIFTILLKRDYATNHFNYERDIHEANGAVLRALRDLRAAGQDQSFFPLLEHSYELLLSMSSLRFRLMDFSILEMCQQELVQISEAMAQSFTTFSVVATIESGTALLQSLYQKTLHVVEKEPLILAIFIENLFEFDRVLKQIWQQLDGIK